jgi:transcriptional regulator with XRE-family HTH domain
MARDLIATILDAEEDSFDLEINYTLPEDVAGLLCEAKGAREWLDAAQELWQERSAVTARALTSRGYSLREVAKLLGLSHQRVDQLLQGHDDAERSSIWAVQVKYRCRSGSWSTRMEPLRDVDVVVAIRPAEQDGRISSDEMSARLRELLKRWFTSGVVEGGRCAYTSVPDKSGREATQKANPEPSPS